jgi:DNA-binding IclR family transcriptional regulator
MSTGIRQAFRILELIAPHPEGVRVTDLAETLGLNRAVPHRQLNLLIEMGYVEQVGASSRYRASFRVGALGLKQLEGAGVHEWIQRRLDDLAASSRELVRLAVATGDSLHWIAKAQGSNSSLIVDPASGAEVVLHATANGKAWLSTLNDADLDGVLSRELEARTDRTITDREVLLGQLRDARSLGYATVIDEMDEGISAIAAPVTPEPGPAVATISIAGPSVRLTEEALPKFADSLIETASALAAEWTIYRHVARAGTPAATAS